VDSSHKNEQGPNDEDKKFGGNMLGDNRSFSEEKLKDDDKGAHKVSISIEDDDDKN
jgi:hypothetical protein